MISASLIVLVIRSRRPFFKSKPSRYLLVATFLTIGGTAAVPYTALGQVFGFIPVPLSFLLVIVAILVLYVVAAEIAKSMFYAKVKM